MTEKREQGLQHYRIDRAKELLAEGSPCIADVAERVGMPDAFVFSRIFKRLTGIPPSRYQVRPYIPTCRGMGGDRAYSKR